MPPVVRRYINSRPRCAPWRRCYSAWAALLGSADSSPRKGSVSSVPRSSSSWTCGGASASPPLPHRRRV